MKKKIGMKLKKIFSLFLTSGILFTSIPTNLLVTQVHALSNVSGNKIIETAQSYSGWGYGEGGTCTGLVSRTLNKLALAFTSLAYPDQICLASSG